MEERLMELMAELKTIIENDKELTVYQSGIFDAVLYIGDGMIKPAILEEQES